MEATQTRSTRGLRGLWGRWRRAERADAERREIARQLYRDAVAQARKPFWYRDLHVPDTPEGRFEMIALHVALLLRRLRTEGTPGQALSQQLFDAMFVDLDGSLRELGVSDLSVGSYIKRLAGNLYARLDALDKSLEGAGDSGVAPELKPMLRANVYLGGEPDDAQVAALARCLIEQDRALAAQEGAALCDGKVVWPALRREVAESGADRVPRRATRQDAAAK